MSRTLAYCNWPIGIAHQVFGFSPFLNTATPELTDGSSRPPFIDGLLSRALLVTVTPTPQTYLLWCAVPKCASRRQGPLIAPCARPMELDSVRLKSWDGRPAHQVPSITTRDQVNRALRMVQAMVFRGSATNSAY